MKRCLDISLKFFFLKWTELDNFQLQTNSSYFRQIIIMFYFSWRLLVWKNEILYEINLSTFCQQLTPKLKACFKHDIAAYFKFAGIILMHQNSPKTQHRGSPKVKHLQTFFWLFSHISLAWEVTETYQNLSATLGNWCKNRQPSLIFLGN